MARSQTTSVADGVMPAGLAPASSGIGGASGLEHYSSFSGSLNPSLTLYHVGGRGEAGFDLVWSFQRTWMAAKRYGGSNPFIPIATYPDDQVQGPNTRAGLLGAGAVFVRTGSHFMSCNGGAAADSTMARIVFEAPNGSQVELVDVTKNGAPYMIPNPCQQTSTVSFDAGRGTAFRSVGGEAIQFTADSPVLDVAAYGFGEADSKVSGYLYLSNGVTYRVDDSTISWIRDRNGNMVHLNYQSGKFTPVAWYLALPAVSSIVDPLGRTISLNYSYSDSSCNGCTAITYAGVAGASRVIKIHQETLATLLRDGGSTQTLDQLFPGTNQPTTSYNPGLASYIELSNGQGYVFRYNEHAELARVQLPTGGAVEYDYGDGHNTINSGFEGSPSDGNPVMVYRRLLERREYASGGNGSSFSSRTRFEVTYPNSTTVDTATTYDNSGAAKARTVTTMFGSPLDALSFNGTSCNASNEGLANQIDSGSPNTVMSVHMDYVTQSGCADTPKLSSITTTLDGKVSQKAFDYDQFMNVKEMKEYDWGTGVPGGLLRRTTMSYVTDPNYTNAGLVRLPTESRVFDAAGTQQAYTTFHYDEYSTPGLADAPTVQGHDPNYGGSKTVRGNLTAVLRASSRVGVDTITKSAFDITGNVVLQTDPNNHSISYGFTDGTYAHPNRVTDAQGHPTDFTYDFYTGLLTQSTDPNGVATTYRYDDSLDRVTQVKHGAGTSVESHINYVYQGPNQTLQYVSQSSDWDLRTDTWTDGLGRTVEVDSYEDGSHYIATQTKYNALGKVDSVSNPFRPGDNVIWTAYGYDTLGRNTSITGPDGQSSSTAFTGQQTTVTDEAGKKKRYAYDGLGRLTSVVEDPDSSSYLTSYVYDVLGNLTSVTQGNQTRQFVYDGLNQLTSASNPESGTVSYWYDPAGNLTAKKDARNTTTAYSYDSLNRITGKSYSDGTPAVRYSYDTNGVSNSIGHLTRVESGVEGDPAYLSTAYTGFDPMGRVGASTQTTNGQTYSFTYVYDLAGHLNYETYPTGRVISYNYDQAGRVNTVGGAIWGQSTYSYVTQTQYAAHGGPSLQMYGNSVARSTFFNARLQPFALWDDLNNDTNQFLFIQNPICWGSEQSNVCNPAARNNGNMYGALTFQGGPGQWPTLSITQQTYAYDNLNRLATANDSVGWSRSFGYDQYGNMWVTQGGMGTTPTSNIFGPTNNRMSGVSYDAAGNQGVVNGDTMQYDAENHQTSAIQPQNVGGGTERYYYDGLGQRVAKSGPGGTTVYVYDIFGRVTGEYSSTVPSSSCQRCFLSYDYLGNLRMVTNESGQAIARHEYLPFGEENTTNRGAGWGANADTMTGKFTGQDHDGSTGLDFFQARYYGPALGRFTGPDPGNAGVDLYNPQSWNGYSYVGNSPLVFIDPTGESFLSVFKKIVGAIAIGASVLTGFGVAWAAPIATAAGYLSGASQFAGLVASHSAPPIAQAPWSEQITLSSIPNAGQFRNDASKQIHGVQWSNEFPDGVWRITGEISLQNDSLFESITFGIFRGVFSAAGSLAESEATSWVRASSTLRSAATGKGNFGIGTATRAEADQLGRSWVGSGYEVARDGKTLVSRDGLRTYRPPTFKPQQGRVQANFEQKLSPGARPYSNAHLDIK